MAKKTRSFATPAKRGARATKRRRSTATPGASEARAAKTLSLLDEEEKPDADDDRGDTPFIEAKPARRDSEGGAESGVSPFGRYLRELQKGPTLLTPAEEIELGRRMAARAVRIVVVRLAEAERLLKSRGRKKASTEDRLAAQAFIEAFNPKGLKGRRLETALTGIYFGPSSPEKDSMIRFLKEDPEGSGIVRILVEANLRLVVNVAKRFVGLLPLPDLVQEGNIGLMHAVPLFDYRRGFRFSTYVTWWIRHAIGRAIADKGRTIRLPVHLLDAGHQIGKKRSEMAAELGREPTDEDLAKAMGVDAEKIGKMRVWTQSPVSIDEPISSERDDPLGDFLAVEAEEPLPWTPLIPDKGHLLLEEEFRKLKPMEQDVLRLRFGLTDDELTLREIGDKYGLSRERIRQLQEAGLAKLRRSMRLKLDTA